MKQLGVIIIIIGFALTIFTAFRYFTKEKVLAVGPVEVTKDKEHTISWSPIVGIALIGIGGLVVWQSSKK